MFLIRIESISALFLLSLIKGALSETCFYYPEGVFQHPQVTHCMLCCPTKAMTADGACCYPHSSVRWYSIWIPIATFVMILLIVAAAVFLCCTAYRRNKQKNGYVIGRNSQNNNVHQHPYINYAPDDFGNIYVPSRRNSATMMSRSHNIITTSTSNINGLFRSPAVDPCCPQRCEHDELVWERDYGRGTYNIRSQKTFQTTVI